jgi:hypothetical protein
MDASLRWHDHILQNGRHMQNGFCTLVEEEMLAAIEDKYPHLSALLDPSQKNNVFYFTLLWMLFESTYFRENGASPKKIWDRFLSKSIDNQEELFICFKKRYVKQDGSFTEHYKSLMWENREEKRTEVESVLLGDGTQNILCAMLVIVYRIRNNLFHGKKMSKDDRIIQLEILPLASRVLLDAIKL